MGYETARDLEQRLKSMEEEHKKSVDALRIKHRDKTKRLRAAIVNKKRQERTQMRSDVGAYFISKFNHEGKQNPDLSTEDYIRWIDKLIQLYKDSKNLPRRGPKEEQQ